MTTREKTLQLIFGLAAGFIVPFLFWSVFGAITYYTTEYGGPYSMIFEISVLAAAHATPVILFFILRKR